MAQTDFESFKESGLLEYSADCVFGLQYQIVGDDDFIHCSSLDKKRQMLQEQKEKEVRTLSFVCLKNRYGRIPSIANLTYYANKDLFVELSSSYPTNLHNHPVDRF